MDYLEITVANTTDSTALRPVTGGVPIAESAAPQGCKFALKDEQGKPVPCQAQVIAKWPDGSARWVLLDFQSEPPPEGALKYRLTWNDEPPAATTEAPVQIRAGRKFCMRSADTMVRPARHALLSLSRSLKVNLFVTDSTGRDWRAAIESARIESKGDMRSTLALRGAFRANGGERLFGFRVYVHAFAGLPRLLVEPMVLMDSEKGVVQRFREVRLEIRPIAASPSSGRLGVDHNPSDASVECSQGSQVRLFQIDDRQYVLEGAEGSGERAPGWAEMTADGKTTAVAVRDFWQQWPKSLEVGPDGIKVGLFPRFEAGAFDHMLDPWYKHDYLFDGKCYRLRAGQTRRWQVWIDLDGNGAELVKHANAPLVPAAHPDQVISTGAFGDVLHRGAPGMEQFDSWADFAFDAYVKAINEARDYGAMNWGDWFGERVCNWGNEEYDTTRQFMLEFARTGDPKYLHLGGANARHNSEVDIIHFVNEDLKSYFLDEVCSTYTNRGIIDNYPIRPGMNHAHCVGHVGGFHPVEKIRQLYIELRGGAEGANPYLCLDPYCISHVFTHGMMWYYFFTGDPWVHETMIRIADNLSRLVLDGKFPFRGRACAGREMGWPMLAIAAVYEIDHNPRYMRAMKRLADLALEYQDAETGGWLELLTRGRCECGAEQHLGEAAFIRAIRLNGLYRYYKLSGDERMPECIRRGTDDLNRAMWDEERGGWRHTPCPNSAFGGQPGVVMMAMANAVRLFDEPEHKRILRKAWNTLFERRKPNSPDRQSVGKAFGSGVYGLAEAASVLASRLGDVCRRCLLVRSNRT